MTGARDKKTDISLEDVIRRHVKIESERTEDGRLKNMNREREVEVLWKALTLKDRLNRRTPRS